MNWWDSFGKENVKPKDDTPDEIKEHPEYKKLVDRFLPEFFKDANLEKHKAGKPQIDHDVIKETKEREGYYPNELDQEMQGYTYGDRLIPAWIPYVASKNYWDYWSHQGTFAPPFNPNGTYESPYWDYGNRNWWGVWNNNKHGYWGSNDPWYGYMS